MTTETIEMIQDYILIYNWLKNEGAKIARTDEKYSEALDLINIIPEPNAATEAEIRAIAIEILSGNFEWFYSEEVSGKKLSDLAEIVFPNRWGEVGSVYSQLDKEHSNISPYICHYTNDDYEYYGRAKNEFSNYIRYFSRYALIGIVLDEEYKGHGILVDNYDPIITEPHTFENNGSFHGHGTIVNKRNPIIADDGNFDENYRGEITLLDFNHINHGNWCAKTLSAKDIRPISVRHFAGFVYFTVLLDGKKTTILVDKRER